MTAILSKPLPVFDNSLTGLRGAAGDLGEALAFLSGGVRPDPETLARLCQSMRLLQGWLIQQSAKLETTTSPDNVATLLCRKAEITCGKQHGGIHEPH